MASGGTAAGRAQGHLDALVLDRVALAKLIDDPNGDVAKDLLRRAVKVDRLAKNLCPVDTGRLRASITFALTNDAKGLLALVGTNVAYAPYVELGAQGRPAQPFLRPALAAVR